MHRTALLAALVVSAFSASTHDLRAAADAPADGTDAPVAEANASADGADPPLAPADGGPRRWRVEPGGALELHDAPAATAPVVATVDAGTLLTNLGCERLDGRVWCGVEAVRGRPHGHVSAERLRPAKGPDGTVPTGVDDSARRARERNFDAHGSIRCSQERGERPGDCEASVARAGGGDATVVVRFPNGFARTLHFTHGELVSADATMSGTGSDVDWRREDGRHLVRVDDQRYELPEELVVGR